MTIKNFIENHPNAIIHLETGAGYVTITPEQRDKLLSGGSVFGHPGVPGKEFEREITADELLPQIITLGAKGGEARETWYLQTSFPEELSLSDGTSDEDRLLKRIQDNYKGFVGEMSLLSPQELFGKAEEITAVRVAYAWLTEFGWDFDSTQDLLKSSGPLQVVADTWHHICGITSDEEFMLVLSKAASFCSEEAETPEQSM